MNSRGGIHLETALPGELDRVGEEWAIAVGFAPSPFGLCLLGEGPRGICHLSFADPGGESAALAALAALSADWPGSSTVRDDSKATRLAGAIFEPGTGESPRPPLRVFVRGSVFRVRVWEALLKIPPGTLVSYSALAQAIGEPRAVRAVASAVAANLVSYLIPCHRVIQKSGAIGNYRWGAARKRAMIDWERLQSRWD